MAEKKEKTVKSPAKKTADNKGLKAKKPAAKPAGAKVTKKSPAGALKNQAEEKKLQSESPVDLSVQDAAEENIQDFNQPDNFQFSGEYIKAIGRRKQAIAKVRLYKDGRGIIMINGLKANKYLAGEGAGVIGQPLKVSGHARDFNFSVLAHGGGKQGQVGAIRLGISRAILAVDPAAKEALKANGFLTRDPRQVERKKPGLRKARKAPQWSKR